MREQIVSQSLIEIDPESEHLVLRIGAIGPDEVADRFFFDLLDHLIRHFAGSHDARIKSVHARRAVCSRKEIEAGVFGDGKNLFTEGIFLFHELDGSLILLRQMLGDADAAALGYQPCRRRKPSLELEAAVCPCGSKNLLAQSTPPPQPDTPVAA